jgi:ABC-2 type transport system permease protein
MNVIRSSLRLARKDLKILFKDRGQLVVLFVLPLILALIFGGAYATIRDPVTTRGETKLSINAYVVNQDEGPYGEQVAEVLHDIKALRTYTLRSVSKANEKVSAGEASAAIIIPADFSARINANQPARVQLIKNPTGQVESQIVAGILNEALTELSVRAEIEYGIHAVYEKTGVLESADPELVRASQAQTMGVIWTAVQEMRQNPAITVQIENLAGKEVVTSVSGALFAFYMPTLATIFAFFLVGAMAESILREKEAGSFRRLLAAPIHRGTVIAGKMLAYIGVVFLQMLVLFGICRAFFDMPLGSSPLGLFTLTLALSLAATSLGMLIGSIARTTKQAGGIGLVLGFVLMIASGTFSSGLKISGGVAEMNSPTEGFVFYISQLTPHAHALDGYLELILKGAGLVDIVPNILVLLGFAVVFFMVAIWRFKFD